MNQPPVPTQNVVKTRIVEEELRQKELQIQSIAENLPGVVYQVRIDPDGTMKVMYVAGGASRVFGMPPDEPDVFSWFISRLDLEDQARLMVCSRESIEKLTPWFFTGIFNMPSGERRWVQGRSLPQIQDGRLYYNGVFLDVTDQKRAEEELRTSRKQYQQILNTAQEGIWMSNAEFHTVYVNERMASMLGYAPAEMIGLPIEAFVVPSHWPEFERKKAERRLEKNEVYEGQLCRKDGSTIWALISASAMFDEHDQFEGAFAMATDISEQKKTAEILKENEASYRALFENAPDAILLLRNDRCVRFNRRSLDLFGVTEEELAGTKSDAFSPLRQRDGALSAEKILPYVIEALAGRPQLFEWLHERPDGVQFDAEVSLSRVDLPGEPLLQAVVRDVSDRKRAEARQRALQTQLVQAQKMEAVGKLAGGVAHDFNNVVTAILVHLNILKFNKQMPPSLIAGLTELEAEAKRAASLTRQLLMFSRRQVMQPQLLDINSLLGNLLRMLRRLIGENISLIFDGTPEDLWIEADPGMLEQVVMNLVVNARDAMPNGGSVTITTSNANLKVDSNRPAAEASVGEFICLEVSDTGCGIEPDILKNIFEPFFTTKEEGKGTGLGLATVHAIVTQHNGWVEVDSTVGKGSVFRVFVPAKSPPRVHAGAGTESEPLQGGTETILLVEDETAVRRNMVLLLREIGYDVIEAQNGEEATAIWKKHKEKIALLLADMVMPGSISGLGLAKLLTQQKGQLKVILMSGYSSELTGIPPLKGISFLQKPFDSPTLTRVIRERLDSREGGSGYISTIGNAPERR